MARPNRGPQLSSKKNRHGFYDICWSENGRSRRRSTGCSNSEDAALVYADFLRGFEQQKIRPNTTTIGQCIAHYWRKRIMPRAEGKETAFYNLRNAATHFCGFDGSSFSFKDADKYFEALDLHHGGYLPSEVTDDLVSEYVKLKSSGVIGRKSTNGGIRRDLEAFRSALIYTSKTGFAPGGFEFPPYAMPEPPLERDRWLTDEERDKLLEAARGSTHALPRSFRFIVLALATAARPAAIKEMRKAQVDLDNGVIHLNPRGRRQTNKRRPSVPIAGWAKPLVERMINEVEGEFLLGHPGSIRSTFNTAVKNSGLENVTPYVLRHTWATRAAQKGTSMWTIAGVLGDRVDTVTKNYLHHCPEHLREAVDHWGEDFDPEQINQ